MSFLLAITLLVTIPSVASSGSIKNTVWVGKNYESIAIGDTTAYIDINSGMYEMQYSIKSDSLGLYFPSIDNAGHEHNDSVHSNENPGLFFTIESQDEDSIVLRPYRSDKYAQLEHMRSEDNLFDSNCTITLYKYALMRDSVFSFKQLLFDNRYAFKEGFKNTSMHVSLFNGEYYVDVPHGLRIVFHPKIIIDNLQNLYFYSDKYDKKYKNLYDGHAFKPGYYQGHLGDSLYNELIRLLQYSCLDYLQLKRYVWDATQPSQEGRLYKLDIYYNNEHKILEGSRFPYLSYDLCEYLLNIDNEISLTPSGKAKAIFRQFEK